MLQYTPETDVFFSDKKILVNHILSKIEITSSIRVLKVLYLLYAYYGATYGSLKYDDDEFEKYPSRLFDADFEAWQYGPVDCEVWSDYKYDKFEKKEFLGNTSQEKDVILFINDLITQMNEVNDFGLVERTHQDTSWSNVYRVGEKHIKMDNDKIVEEYIEKYVGA
ncbi:type II toxin-antitoxin system antitoxin SocA domain-containing protein [Lactococcus lactis]|uniref:type II toxin-antitoxin system antitoxin SocA domain-containing protein n=1 Tax=Lactococcus lactis TaxID=1358 RepID=UPI00289191C8|nr:type II toxin-antitoxin system antitoxin SocA domain-containing protein [Lactococcus lactis]MDT2904151.1 DUF4065 domain-containing protein [Lactococcus lactis]